jgi:hypothetical protein
VEYHAEPVAEYHAEPVAETETASSNGHSVAWETSSLAASDERLASHDDDAFRDSDVPEGISIWLSHNTPVAEPEPESHEKGSVSLSFSFDDMPDVLSNADVPFVAGQHPEQAVTTVAEHANPGPSIETPPEQPEASRTSTMPENPPAGVYSSSNGTSKHVNGTPAPAPAPSGNSATADIVGSLISRALTFRIK